MCIRAQPSQEAWIDIFQYATSHLNAEGPAGMWQKTSGTSHSTHMPHTYPSGTPSHLEKLAAYPVGSCDPQGHP
jgi:hypothetical protein